MSAQPVNILDLLRSKQPAADRGEWQPYTGDGPSRYGMAALQREADNVAHAGQGVRNDTLNKAIYSLSQLVASGHLDADTVHATLTNAGRHCGLDDVEIAGTLRSGYNAGIKQPRDVPAPWEQVEAPNVYVLDNHRPTPEGGDTTAEPEPEPAERERTSWWPRDLEAAIRGDAPETPPTVLHRTDGQHVFYPGKVNGLIGPSESGKTWVALLGVAQELAAGRQVTYLDFEDTETGIVDRLRTLGVADDAMRHHLAYIGPDSALDALGSADLAEHLEAHSPGLVVLDGVNAAMTLLGYDLMSNADATAFAQRLLRPLSALGCAVVYIDHTPKNAQEGSAGGIGAQAKRAMTTGCALRVEVVKAFGKGQDGRLRLHVDKDRPGVVRGASAPGQSGHWAGDVVIEPDGDALQVRIDPPHDARAADFRPTELMRRVSEFLESAGAPQSGRQIEDGVRGKSREFINKALNRLVVEGYVTRTAGPRGGFMHTLVATFDDDSVTTIVAGRGQSPTSPDLPRPPLGEVAQGSVTSPGDRVGPKAAPRGEVAERDSGKVAETAPPRTHLDPVTGLFIDTTTGEVVDR